MKFLLVRHVETTGNAENRFAGITETQYTQKGEKQFIKLTQELKNYSFDVIYSSPISRALKIAKEVSANTQKEVIIKDVLSEMNFGIFENLKFTEITEKHKDDWDKWEKDFVNYVLPQGDSLYTFHNRIATFIDSIKNDQGSCLVVCHGGTIQSILTHLLDLDLQARWHFHIPLGGLVEIEYNNNHGMMNILIPLVE